MMTMIANLCQELQIDCKAKFSLGCEEWLFCFYDHYTEVSLGRVTNMVQAHSWLEGHKAARDRLGAIHGFPIPEEKLS